MTIKVPTVFRDAHDIELRLGDTVVPVYEPGAKPRSVPADAGRGVVVGFGSRRVYVQFEGDQFYSGPSDFHRIYARDLMVVKTVTGVSVNPLTRRTTAEIYEDLTGMWTLEIATPAGEPALQATLGRDYLGSDPDADDVWWDVVTEMADRLIWEAGWRAAESWNRVNETKGELNIVSAPNDGAVWEIPEEALEVVVTDADRGIWMAVSDAMTWFADLLAAQYQGGEAIAMVADMRNFAEQLDLTVEGGKHS